MPKIAYLSTWPPRPCGIATFAYDLAQAIFKIRPDLHWGVIALTNEGEDYDYGKEVIYKINQYNLSSYLRAAEFFNSSDFEILLIQHEYNLYGKMGGARLLKFLNYIKKPTIVIAHSVPHPKDKKYAYKKRKIEILKKISLVSQKIVAVCNLAKERMTKIYKINPSKIVVIYHGSPAPSTINPEILKKRLGYKENTPLLLNFGFIAKRKGLETVIKAMPKIVKSFPKAKLLFLGGGHPADFGSFKAYLLTLKKLCKNLKVEKNIDFVTGFIPIKQVMDYYKAADIFICANNFKSQISSGPLTYAVASGKAIVSSSFTYAEDLLSNNRGIIYPIGNHHKLAAAVCKILQNPKLKKMLEKRTISFGKKLLWGEVAKNYIKLFEEMVSK